MQYSELQCSEAIHKAVERMGFAEMTEIQEKTIPVMLAGRDVIAKAPTGTGKTCAFGIPVAEHIDAALKAPQAVIMAPTRELAQQIADCLRADEKVTIAGFGRFEMRPRKPKAYTNPKTKVSSRLESTSIPGFKASGRFKQKLEAGKAEKTEEAV